MAFAPSFERLENLALLSGGLVFPPASVSFTPAAGPGSSDLTPSQIKVAYGLNLLPSNLDGRDTEIAILDQENDPQILNDLETFDAGFGLIDPNLNVIDQYGNKLITNSQVTGQSTPLPQTSARLSIETSLDVEYAHAIAPRANILLVEFDGSLSGLQTAVDLARNTSGVVAVSMSFGLPEGQGPGFYSQAEETALDPHFTTPPRHNGVVFVAATGDSGGAPAYPAVSPNVLAVGGTNLNVDSLGNRLPSSPESAWSGSSGGQSLYEPEPAAQRLVQTTGMRTVPDVAYDAGTPVLVYDSENTPPQDYDVTGTSAGAPQWAALIALADQKRAENGSSPLQPFQVLPDLYTKSSYNFHDITTGSNNAGIAAVPGYDQVTGIGTPAANLLVQSLGANPVAYNGDFDGDHKTDYAIFDETAAYFSVQLSTNPNGQRTKVLIGTAGDDLIPVVGDFDGDGKTDFAVYDETTGIFKVQFSGNGQVATTAVGTPGDINIPVVGDFYGTHHTDFAVYDSDAKAFDVKLLATDQNSTVIPIGQQFDTVVPAVGDFDGDGKTDYAVWDPIKAYFLVQLSSDQSRSFVYIGQANQGLTPVVGDFDGDGKTDYTIFNDTGTFYASQLSSMPNVKQPTIQIGQAGETNIPV